MTRGSHFTNLPKPARGSDFTLPDQRGSPSAAQSVTLERRFSSLAGATLGGVLFVGLSVFFYTGTADRPLSGRLLVSLWPLALAVLDFSAVVFLSYPLHLQMGNDGVTIYPKSRLRPPIP